MRSLSICTGIGGIELGMSVELPIVPAISYEVDDFANSVLGARFPGCELRGDVKTIASDVCGDIDVLLSGFPCQPHSTAGSRMGEADARELGAFVLDAVAAHRPSICVFENVPGLLTTDGGVYYWHFLARLVDMGYVVEWDIIPTSMFFKPHIRDRLIIVARTDGRTTYPVFTQRTNKSWEWPVQWDAAGMVDTEGDYIAFQRRFPAVRSALWCTPTRRDYKDVGENVNWAKILARSKLPGYLGGSPHPELLEWMMGFPRYWTDAERPVDKSLWIDYRYCGPQIVPSSYPNREKRQKALGNSVSPLVASLIGRFIRHSLEVAG